jgi:hypothetical protein
MAIIRATTQRKVKNIEKENVAINTRQNIEDNLKFKKTQNCLTNAMIKLYLHA